MQKTLGICDGRSKEFWALFYKTRKNELFAANALLRFE